jgi:hypothetical protein
MRDGEVLNVDHDTEPQILRLPDVGFDTREILHPKVIDKHYATRQELFPTTQFLAVTGTCPTNQAQLPGCSLSAHNSELFPEGDLQGLSVTRAGGVPCPKG